MKYYNLKFGMALLLLGPIGCSSDPEKIEFCSVGSGDSSDRLVLNTTMKTLRREGALSQYIVFESNIARGFVSPFPFALPKPSVLKEGAALTEGTLHWQFDRYDFTAERLTQYRSDWVLITAQPSTTGNFQSAEITWHTSVLYSITDGVISVRTISEHGTVSSVSTAFSCGTLAMHAASF